ncbi:hypothetical protein [Azospirillum doebereinerae]
MAKEPPVLGEGRVEVLGRTIATLAGTIPCVGPIIQVAITETIPSTRIERIEAFLIYIQERLDEQKLDDALKTKEGLDIFEEGISQAARALSEERKRYIAELVAKGMDSDKSAKKESRHILRILNQIDDAQIVILNSYQSKYQKIDEDGDDDFFDRHREILGPFSREIGEDNSEMEKAELKDAFEHHLSSFGLLRVKTEDYGSLDGGIDTRSVTYEITPQGERFLKALGLVDL